MSYVRLVSIRLSILLAIPAFRFPPPVSDESLRRCWWWRRKLAPSISHGSCSSSAIAYAISTLIPNNFALLVTLQPSPLFRPKASLSHNSSSVFYRTSSSISSTCRVQFVSRIIWTGDSSSSSYCCLLVTQANTQVTSSSIWRMKIF